MVNIEFTIEDEKKVMVRVNSGVPVERSWFVAKLWESSTDIEAILIKRQIEKTFEERAQAIRREAYERGWKDAKAKRAKQHWFSTFF